MNDRRQKYVNNISNQKQQLDIAFDITELDLMCQYIISENSSIHRNDVFNMKRLFSIINLNIYNNDTERLNRIDFINKGIEARLQYNLTTTDMILTHISGGFGSVKNDSFKQLNRSEVEWVNSTISETLKYSLIFNDVDDGQLYFLPPPGQ